MHPGCCYQAFSLRIPGAGILSVNRILQQPFSQNTEDALRSVFQFGRGCVCFRSSLNCWQMRANSLVVRASSRIRFRLWRLRRCNCLMRSSSSSLFLASLSSMETVYSGIGDGRGSNLRCVHRSESKYSEIGILRHLAADTQPRKS